MKTKLIIGFLALNIAFISVPHQAFAQKKDKEIPATHIWVRTGQSVVWAPARSLDECKIMTRQAAMINSSQAKCFNGERFVADIDCQKSPRRGELPECK